ncbi:MAG: nuclear transport factor 2 family protein [bacterium]|nr:nuclear transport factor 2 family protein [bacterium]
MRAALLGLAALALIGAAPVPTNPTEANRAIVADFARVFYADRDVRKAFTTYVAPDYVQHNPGIADGRDAAIAALEPMFSRPGARFEVKRILVDGDYAVIHLYGRADPTSAGGAVVDIYRLKGGQIVEHWDVLQPMPTTSANPHPMF